MPCTMRHSRPRILPKQALASRLARCAAHHRQRNNFPRQVVGVAADGAGVDVLVTAQGGKAVGKYQDGRRHAPAWISRATLRDIFIKAKFLQAVCDGPEPVYPTRSYMTGNRRLPLLYCGGNQMVPADMRVPQRVVPQDAGVVLQFEQLPGGPCCAY